MSIQAVHVAIRSSITGPSLTFSSYSFEARACPESGAHAFLGSLDPNRPQQFSCLHPTWSWGTGMCGMPGLLMVLGSKLQSLRITGQALRAAEQSLQPGALCLVCRCNETSCLLKLLPPTASPTSLCTDAAPSQSLTR